MSLSELSIVNFVCHLLSPVSIKVLKSLPISFYSHLFSNTLMYQIYLIAFQEICILVWGFETWFSCSNLSASLRRKIVIVMISSYLFLVICWVVPWVYWWFPPSAEKASASWYFPPIPKIMGVTLSVGVIIFLWYQYKATVGQYDSICYMS